jgi:putative ABC transport system ATP-binding protein
MITTEQVVKIYNQGKQSEVIPVNNVSLQIEKGQMIILKGPSGSGKTTLLSMIGCQTKPTSGKVVVNGKDVSKLPERFANQFKRDQIGFVFQNLYLIPDLSVSDNIALPLLPVGINARERTKRVEALLEAYNLTNRRNFKVRELSGGEQQRVAIARALVNQCNVLLADEPTAHLDSQLAGDFMNHMTALKKTGFTILMTSHDPAICDNPEIDRVFEMKDGRVVL